MVLQLGFNQGSFEGLDSQRARCPDAVNSCLELLLPQLQLELHAVGFFLQLLFELLGSQPQFTSVVPEILRRVNRLIRHFLQHLVDCRARVVIFLLFLESVEIFLAVLDVVLHLFVVLGEGVDLAQRFLESLVDVLLEGREQLLFFLLLLFLWLGLWPEPVQDLVLHPALLVCVVLLPNFPLDLFLLSLRVLVLEDSQVLLGFSINLLLLDRRWRPLGVVHGRRVRRLGVPARGCLRIACWRPRASALAFGLVRVLDIG